MPGTDSSAAGSAQLTGRRLDDYQLLRRLGKGAMAEVYLAEQVSLRRQVAFKVLRADLASDSSYLQRFHREAQAAASLVHANIVQVYEVGCVDGVHFIAQEYVQGSNLAELLLRRGTPTLQQALGIMLQTASALNKAAEHGIVHRDIKPENILLTEDFDVKVADFGLARAANDQHATTLTQVGFTMGTPLYMSPEQIEGRPLDGRSDIYSLGVTCYHMLAGQAPFRGETALSVAVQHLREEAPRLENVRPDLPPSLCRIVHKMLAKNADERYVSARELARELRAVVASELDEAQREEILPLADDMALSSTTAHLDATHRLGELMQATARSQRRSWETWLYGAAVLLAFGGGLALAARRTEPLIRPLDPSALNITKKANAEAQFVYASIVNNEEAWKSVPAYFPDETLWNLKARQELARLYLRDDDYARAKEIFDELADQPNVEVKFRAFGLAGQAIVLAMQDKHQQSAERLAELWPIRKHLDDSMRNLMAYVLRRNQKALAGSESSRWTEFLQPALPGDAS